MAYSRKPNYHFSTKFDTGIDKVPPGRVIIIDDYEGDGTNISKTFIKKVNDADITTTTTTIEQFIANKALDSIFMEDIILSQGKINNTLLDLPLQNVLSMKIGAGLLTFNRDTTATYIDNFGIMRYAAIDEARFNKGGYLTEPASTNLQINSDDFTNTAWDKRDCTCDKSTTQIGVDGVSYMSEMTSVDSGSDGTIDTLIWDQYDPTNWVTGDKITQSWFMKAGTPGVLANIVMNNGAIGGGGYLKVSLDNFTVIDSRVESYKIEYIRDNIYRVSATFIYDSSVGSANNIHIYFDKVDGSQEVAGDFMYIEKAQLEKLDFATSYIPTVDAAVTRNRDELIIEANNNINATADFSIAIDFEEYGVENLYPRLWQIDGTPGPSMLHTEIWTLHFAGVSTSAGIYASMIKEGINRIVITKKDTLVKIYLNGIKVSESIDFYNNLHLSAASIYIGHDGTQYRNFTGNLTNFRTWNFALDEISASLA